MFRPESYFLRLLYSWVIFCDKNDHDGKFGDWTDEKEIIHAGTKRENQKKITFTGKKVKKSGKIDFVRRFFSHTGNTSQMLLWKFQIRDEIKHETDHNGKFK